MPSRSPLPAIVGITLLVLTAGSRLSAKVFVIDFENSAPAGQLSLSAIPAEPVNGVSDTGGALPGTVFEQARTDLSAASSAPVYLVIPENPPPEGTSPEAFANELLRRWAKPERPLAALVFTSPKPLASVHVAIAGRNLSPDDARSLRAIGSDALAGMPSQAPFAEAAAAAARTLTRDLGAVTLSTPAPPAADAPTPVPMGSEPRIIVEPETPPPSSRWEALTRDLNWQTVRLWASAIGGLLVAVCAFFLIQRTFGRRGLMFPEHLPRKRFSAPFSGGSNAQIGYRQ